MAAHFEVAKLDKERDGRKVKVKGEAGGNKCRLNALYDADIFNLFKFPYPHTSMYEKATINSPNCIIICCVEILLVPGPRWEPIH